MHKTIEDCKEKGETAKNGVTRQYKMQALRNSVNNGEFEEREAEGEQPAESVGNRYYCMYVGQHIASSAFLTSSLSKLGRAYQSLPISLARFLFLSPS